MSQESPRQIRATVTLDIAGPGILGDNRVVWMYLQPLPEMPALYPQGVPTLC
jgi:hypothetical protein